MLLKEELMIKVIIKVVKCNIVINLLDFCYEKRFNVKKYLKINLFFNQEKNIEIACLFFNIKLKNNN